MRDVLPAPFGPITAKSSSGPTAIETSSSATTPPNCIRIPTASSTARDGMSGRAADREAGATLTRYPCRGPTLDP